MRYWQNLATTTVLLQSTRTPNKGFLKTGDDEMPDEISHYSLLQILQMLQRLQPLQPLQPLHMRQRTATELADAKTTATEHYSCLIGVGACAQIFIFERERER